MKVGKTLGGERWRNMWEHVPEEKVLFILFGLWYMWSLHIFCLVLFPLPYIAPVYPDFQLPLCALYCMWVTHSVWTKCIWIELSIKILLSRLSFLDNILIVTFHRGKNYLLMSSSDRVPKMILGSGVWPEESYRVSGKNWFGDNNAVMLSVCLQHLMSI